MTTKRTWRMTVEVVREVEVYVDADTDLAACDIVEAMDPSGLVNGVEGGYEVRVVDATETRETNP